MKAVAKTRPALGVEVIEVPTPTIRPHEVLVKVKACGICGSDLHHYEWDGTSFHFSASIMRIPRILGHEGAGVIVEVGKEVVSFREGDRVTFEPGDACGLCYYCRLGRFRLCERAVRIGSARDGALAEFVAVPAENLYLIPENLSFEEGAALEPLGVGVKAIEVSSLKPGDDVVVLGPGPIGLSTALAARAGGAGQIMVAGLAIDKGRLGLTAELGFPTAVARTEEIVEKVMGLTQGYGADIVFDAAGALPDAIPLVKKGGEIVLIGVPENPLGVKDLVSFFTKSLTVRTSFGHNPSTWNRTLNLAASQIINVKSIITHSLPIEKAVEGFEMLRRKEGVKVLITP